MFITIKTLKNWDWRRCVGILAITSINFLFLPSGKAQLIPDHTLGGENSVVTPQGLRNLIQGGARRGGNVFHSFAEFNIGEQQQVYFANPAGVANILTRVTGNNVSHIFGTLGVDGVANLFLINPNGIIFGAGARLDVAGSFVASTAEGIKLGEAGLFSAAEPEKSTLLSIQPGVLFTNALRQHQAEIRNHGSLKVGNQQRLTLQADIVSNTGKLIAPRGTVQVLGNQVSLLNNASIDVSSPMGGGTVLIGNGEQIDIGPGVRINADATPPNPPLVSGGNGDGGTVIIKSDDTTRFQGQISARGGVNSGNGGFVEVSGGNLQFSGTVDTTAPFGTVGTLLLDPKNILIQAGSPISGLAVSQALFLNDVILQADNDITVDDDITGIGTNSLTLLAGRSLTLAPNRSIRLNGGNFTAKFNDENALIPTDRDPGIAQFIIMRGSQILTNGGNVTLASGSFGQTSQINTANAGIFTSNIAGNSGNITLFALGDITTGLLDTRSGTGNGGDISLSSAGGAIATTNSVLADSVLEAGDISFTATGDVKINGNILSGGSTAGQITLNTNGILSGKGVNIANTTIGSGPPKDLIINAGSIEVENTSIGTNIEGSGQGGKILVNAANEFVLRNSGIASVVYSGNGNAGEVSLTTRRLRIIREPGPTIPFGKIGVGSIGNQNTSGNGGNLTINASESVEIIGNRPGPFRLIPTQVTSTLIQTDTGIATSAFGSGNSGKLTINTGRLVVRDGGGISTYPAVGKGGNLEINATEILLQGESGIGTTTLGLGDAGDLMINAGKVTVTDGAAIGTATFGTGTSGNLTILVDSLSIRNGSLVGSTTIGPGNGATLTVKAKDLIEVVGTSADGRLASGLGANTFIPQSGNAGTVYIETDRLVVRQRGEISSATLGAGEGGDIQIQTRTLQLDNGKINASTAGAGNGGNITIRATESVTVTGTGYEPLQEQIIVPSLRGTLSLDNYNQGIVTVTAGQGVAGNVLIETPNFIARDGGLIATTTLAPSTFDAPGKGGDITINASDTLELNNSLLGTGTFNAAEAGNVYLTARQLTARGGSQALTTTFGKGKAGDLTVNVSDSIELSDPNNAGTLLSTGLFATSTQTASGDGGDININIPNGDLNIRNGATVSVSAEGTGDAGNIKIDAGTIFLDKGSITATSNSGTGGDIKLTVGNILLLRNNSQISTRAGTENSGGGNGGNMDIQGQFIFAVPKENSDIIANAFAGNGGKISVTAQSILGLQENNTKQPIPISEISASSQLGIDGPIEINTPDVDLSRGLAELASNFTDSSNQIVPGCPATQGNHFVVTGRGGIPDNPSQYLRGRAVWQDTRNLPQQNSLAQPTTHNQQSTNNNQPLIEAQGWIVQEDGTIILTAEPYTRRLPNSLVFSQSCQKFFK